MARKTLVLWILISVCGLRKANVVMKRLKLPEPDEELLAYMEAASSRAKFDFSKDILQTNFYSLFHEKVESQNLKFADNYIQIGDNEVYLMNLKIAVEPSVHLLHVEPNFIFNFMDTELHFNDVTLEGEFEVYQQPYDQAARDVAGKLRMIWKNVKAAGSIAFLPFEHMDGFYSTSYDLKFTSDDFVLLLTIEGDHREDCPIPYDADQHIKDYLQDDLFWKLRRGLRTNIDEFLHTKSILHIFGNNAKIIQRYVEYTQKTTIVINELVDALIARVKAGITESGFWRFPIPSIKREFSKKFWGITYRGHFSAWNGHAENLKTLRRRGDFAVISKNESAIVTGSLEVQQLSAEYDNYEAKIWTTGPAGKISTKVQTNSFSFTVKLVADDKNVIGLWIEDYSFKVHVENIKVSATGLGVLLNWLLSLIMTWVVNIWKGEISQLIENEACEAIDNIIKTLWP